MEILGLEVPLWVSLSTILLSLFYWYGTSTFNTFKKMGVPYQPACIPFVGHMMELIIKSAPELHMKYAKKFPGKVFGVFQGKRPALQVADAEFGKEVTIREFSAFMDRGILIDEDSLAGNQIGVITSDHWKHVRTILAPTFTSGKLKQMYPVIQRCSQRFVKHVKSADAAPIVIKDYTSGYTMDVIASTAFGLEMDVQETTDHKFIYHAKKFFGFPTDDRIITRIKSALNLLIVFVLPQFIRKFLGLFFDMTFSGKETSTYLENLIATILDQTEAKPEKRNNFISMCKDKLVDLDKVEETSIKTTNGKKWTTRGLTRKEVMANAAAFISAGFETTASTLQFFFYLMAIYPDIQDKLYTLIAEVADENGECSYEDMKKLEYLDWCIDESMRMFPIASRINRVANKDITIKGVQIPKGMTVEILVHHIHHDPDYWTDPETFNPDRFAPENQTDIRQYVFIPFGSGSRKCIASRLALLEMKVVVIKSLTEFRYEACADTPKLKDLKFRSSIVVLATATPLKVSVVPRNKIL